MNFFKKLFGKKEKKPEAMDTPAPAAPMQDDKADAPAEEAPTEETKEETV